MKAAVLSLGSISSRLTVEAMKEFFDEVDSLDLRYLEVNLDSEKSVVLYNGKPIKDYDCIYPKGSFRYVALLRSLTEVLQGKTYIPISPDSFSIGHDKLLTQLVLQREGIPMPKTYISATPMAGRHILEKLNFPIILKFPHGTQGKGVVYADSFTSAISVLDALSTLKQSFVIQEFIETNGTDTRAIVIGDKVVASMKRKQTDLRDIRSNIHAGGVGENYEMDRKTKNIAVKAAKSINAEICAVDILDGVKGPLVIEVNLSPGLQGIMKATKKDIPKLIASYLYNKTLNYLNKSNSKETMKIMSDLTPSDLTSESELITNLDFKGDRIVLPKIVTTLTGFKEDNDVVIKAKKGILSLKEFKINNTKK